MPLNQVLINGNLTEDPELRYTPSGAAVASFTVAVNRRIKDQTTGEWKDGETSFFKCNVWRGQAENVAESLTKGMRVIVSGRLRTRNWETAEGQKRTVTEIEADCVGPSLEYATAKVTKKPFGEGSNMAMAGVSSTNGNGGNGDASDEEPPF